MKRFIRKILKEDRLERYMNKIAEVMKNDYPIFSNMELYGFYDQLPEFIIPVVFNKIFGQIVNVEVGYHFNRKVRSVKNENNNLIYYEDGDGFWKKYEYDNRGNRIYYKSSQGHWIKREYDENGNNIYYENGDGYWEKREYDDRGNEIYFENSSGKIIDNR